MERGLIWLPLLALFVGLAWAGWNEFQKVEAYRRWAEEFDRAKYDIYAVLGQKGETIIWGRPTRGDPILLGQFSLSDVTAIAVQTDKGKVKLTFSLSDDKEAIAIPFTDLELAQQWCAALQRDCPKIEV